MNTYMQKFSLTYTHRRNKEGRAGVGREVVEMGAFPRPEDGFVLELLNHMELVRWLSSQKSSEASGVTLARS